MSGGVNWSPKEWKVLAALQKGNVDEAKRITNTLEYKIDYYDRRIRSFARFNNPEMILYSSVEGIRYRGMKILRDYC